MLRNAFTVLVDADVAEADAVVIRLRPRYGPPVTGRIVTGALAGLLATVPMSAAMLLMYRLLPGEERYPLPPHQITVEMAERADQEQLVDEPAEAAVATGAAHFGYGAAVGSLYASLPRGCRCSRWRRVLPSACSCGRVAIWGGCLLWTSCRLPPSTRPAACAC